VRIETRKTGQRVTIFPGEFFISCQPVTISTLLGSCVAVCLYDRQAKVVGMNHFLLSNRRYARHLPMSITEAGRYGIHAMELVINGMLNMGAKRRNLQAKVFGGGSIMRNPTPDDNFYCVGEVNCRFVLEYLTTEDIALIAHDLGGDRGRVVHFSAVDYAVYVRKIKRKVSQALAERDRQYWRQRLDTQEQQIAEPELWE